MGMVSKIIRYESGELNSCEMLELFGELINNGQAWTLQGSYGRTARDLIEGGLLTAEGKITEKGREEICNGDQD